MQRSTQHSTLGCGELGQHQFRESEEEMGGCCCRGEVKERRRGEGNVGQRSGYSPQAQDLVPPYGATVASNDTGTLGGNVRGYVPQVRAAVPP